MFKKFLLLLTFSFTVYAAFASQNSLADRISKPLIIVLSATDEVYNADLKYAVKNYWTINAYTFITEEEMELLKNTSDNLFLIRCENQSAEDAGTVYDHVFKLIYFAQKGKLMNQVAGIPLMASFDGDRPAVINAVRVLQDKLQFMIFKEEKNVAFASFDNHVESRSSIIKMKKLYIAKEDAGSELTEEAVKKVYSGEVVFVSKNELNRLIDSKSEDMIYAVIYNQKTSGISYINTKQIVDAYNGQVVYNEETTSMKPEGFTKKDLKNISE